jgi:hypothetical protein
MLDFLDPRKVAAKKIARKAAQKYHSGVGSEGLEIVEEASSGKGAPPKQAKPETEAKTTLAGEDDFGRMFERELGNLDVKLDK